MQSLLIIIVVLASAAATNLPTPQLSASAVDVPSIVQQIATGPVGGGLVPDWARPSALLQSIVDRLRGSSLPCQSPTGQEGACMLHFNCASVSGVAMSSPDCPQTAVCCRLPEEAATTVSCGGTITANNTNFRNPDFPADFRRDGMCSVEVTFGREVCQLRLDFVHFSIAGPRANGPRVGQCDDDVFAVASGIGNLPYPALCGYNSGQHMYIDVSESTRAVLSFSIGGELAVARKWNVRVSTVHCLSNMKAPESCLQYHTEPAGEFSSYNFRPASATQQLIAGHKYTICFKKQLGFCQISYTASEPGSFQVGPATRPLVGARNCENAYIFVPSGSNKVFLDDITADRFCGRGLAGDVISSDVGPFTVGVVTSRPLGATSGVGAILGSDPVRGSFRGFPGVYDNTTTNIEDFENGTVPIYLVSNATGTYAVYLNSTEAFETGDLSATPVYFKTNATGTYAVFENITAVSVNEEGTVATTTSEPLSVRHGSYPEVQMMKPLHVKVNPHTGVAQSQGQVGFVKGQFAMVKPAHHPISKPVKGATLITVVERPDLSSGAGFEEQPEAIVVSDPKNAFFGGFRMRYMMNHCT